MEKIVFYKHQLNDMVSIYEAELKDGWDYYVGVEGYGDLLFSFGVPKYQPATKSEGRFTEEQLFNLYENGYFDLQISMLTGECCNEDICCPHCAGDGTLGIPC